jgi:hypothetical protein
MLKKLKIAFLSIFIIIITISCNNVKDNVSFTLQPYKVKDSILNVIIKNNTNDDYFLTLDTNRTYGYSFFNYKINNSVIITPKVYENDRFIYPKLEGGIYKKEFFDRNEEIWNKKEIILADNFLADFVLLKNKIMLKRGESKFLKIPFKLIYPYNYNLNNKYFLEKGKKYELQIEYQMQKAITEKNISKIKLDSIEKLGYLPYYEKITSNKVPIIID